MPKLTASDHDDISETYRVLGTDVNNAIERAKKRLGEVLLDSIMGHADRQLAPFRAAVEANRRPTPPTTNGHSTPATPPLKARIIAYLKSTDKPTKVSDIFDHVGSTPAAIHVRLPHMVAENVVERVARGYYRLPTPPKHANGAPKRKK